MTMTDLNTKRSICFPSFYFSRSVLPPSCPPSPSLLLLLPLLSLSPSTSFFCYLCALHRLWWKSEDCRIVTTQSLSDLGRQLIHSVCSSIYILWPITSHLVLEHTDRSGKHKTISLFLARIWVSPASWSLTIRGLADRKITAQQLRASSARLAGSVVMSPPSPSFAKL